MAMQQQAVRRAWNYTDGREPLLVPEDFERLLAENAVTGEPSGDDGEERGGKEGSQVHRPMSVVDEAHLVEQRAGDGVGEDDPDNAGDEAEYSEFNGEDRGDARACAAECLEHDNLADAAVACAGNGGGEDYDAREDGERREELNHVGDLDDD